MPPVTGVLWRHVEVGGAPVDVRVEREAITEVGPALPPRPGEQVVAGGGGALVPGLHDHHLHLLAAARARDSVRLGPPEVRTPEQFVAALQRAAAGVPEDGWVRGVAYHASVAGDLGRADLDAVVSHCCVRVQDRSGALWMLNSRGLAAVGARSRSGRLFGADEQLGARIGGRVPPPLHPLGAELAAYGVTGVTDATPSADRSAMEVLSDAVAQGALPQRVTVTGGPALAAAPPPPGLARGPVKFVVADHALPAVDDVAAAVAAAHEAGRPVALHCVTAVALALALAAWGETGVRPGDRIEHGSVIPRRTVPLLGELGLTVVTQPGFIETRGDRYLLDVDPGERDDLYRCATLLDAGVAVGGSTDAPFGDLDPWRAVAAATTRRTAGGAVIGAGERLAPDAALALFLGDPGDPGGPPRRVAPGAAADLCLLDRPLAAALAAPSSRHVVATMVRGTVVFHR